MSNIEIKRIYDVEDNLVYPLTSTDAVFDSDGIKSLSEQLSDIDSSINELVNSISSVNNTILNLEIYKEVENLQKELSSIKKEVNSLSNDYYNIHIKREHKNKEDNLYLVIEDYNTILNDTEKYTIAFMKKSKKTGEGNTWRVPLFNKNSKFNKYYFDNEGNDISYQKMGNLEISSFINKLPKINSLPCIDIKEINDTNKKNKNTRKIKLYPYYKDENKNIDYHKDITYIFKNSSNKKLHIGYAIFKKVNNKWIRVSNIAKIDLYAYAKDKFFINII